MKRRETFRGLLAWVVFVVGVIGLVVPASASADGLVPGAPAVTVPSVPAIPAVSTPPSAAVPAPAVPAVSAPSVPVSRPAVSVATATRQATGAVVAPVQRAAPRPKARAHARVRRGLPARSLAATPQCNSTQAGSTLNCVNQPLAGEVLNICNGGEPVTLAGTFHVETKVTFDPITLALTVYERKNFQNASGFATATPARTYQANDTDRTTTAIYPLLGIGPIDLYDSDHTELISNDTTPNFLLHETIRMTIDPLTLDVDTKITGPGVKCTNS